MNCGFFPLRSTVLSLTGRDAERYLQARLTNDLRLLSPGHFCEAAALTPQGRTEAFCAVLKRSAQDFLLLCESDRRDELYSAIKRFLVAERVEIKDVSSDFSATHVFCSDTAKLQELAVIPHLDRTAPLDEVRERDGVYAFPRRRTTEQGWDIVAPLSRSPEIQSTLTAAGLAERTADEQLLLRLRAGIPSFPEEINADRLFSESGLMHAVSFTKGCYTGQEVVAKIDALGKTPRVLRRLRIEGTAPVTPGTSVENGSGGPKIGTVLSAAVDPAEQCTWCFCDLKNAGDFSALTICVSGRPAQPI